MTMHSLKAVLWAILALSMSGAAHAQIHFTNEEIVSLIGNCMAENAPDGWQTFIFRLEQGPPVAGKRPAPVVEHKVIVGAAGNPPQDLKPCRPDYVPKAVNTFRENQDEKAKRWTGIVITIQRDASFSVTFNYPK
jgi:hypothetical protein